MHAKDSSTRNSARAGVLIALLLGYFALGTQVQAVNAPPYGGYPNGNTAEGFQALQGLTSGSYNTALGQQALFSNTTGSYNSAEGFRALFRNTTGTYNEANGVNALSNNTTGTNNAANGP